MSFISRTKNVITHLAASCGLQPDSASNKKSPASKESVRLPRRDPNLSGRAEQAKLRRQAEKLASFDRMPTIVGGQTDLLPQNSTEESGLLASPSDNKPKAEPSVPRRGSGLQLVGSHNNFFRMKMRVRPNWAGHKDFTELTAYVYGNKNMSSAERKERLAIANKVVDCQTNPKSDGMLSISDSPNVTALPRIPLKVKELYVSDMANLKTPPNFEESKRPDEAPSLERYTLYNCTGLKRTPDISHLSNLKYLDLDGCNNLTEMPHVGKDSTLEFLNMNRCGELNKPLRKFEGTKLEKFFMDDVNARNFERKDFMTDYQMRKLDHCETLPYVPGNLFNINKEPPALEK
ncbi:hypothetical protein [Actimicrobium antarcticum]|uniref:Uncharacterized protein n=1 Tax=Actimicrobium antarcticum TaxID=1051899 RepID=A0ABP7U0L3_9BURK